MKHLRYCLFTLPLLFCHSAVNATELVQWQRLPLPVELHTGHERVIFVNRNVRVGYPAELDGKLRIQSSGGTVYLRAEADFPDTRLQLSDMDSGELILLDIRASAGEELEPLELRYDDAVWRNDAGTTEDADAVAPAPEQQEPAGPLPVVLTRYAAQRLYAPLRTVEPLAGITPVPVRLPATLTTLLPTEPVTATPLAAWRLGDTTVTAIKLQNRSQPSIDLDPRALQGQFLTATFQHSWLGAHGTPDDTTVVYLVTDGSADRAVVPEPPAPDAKKEVK
ncbi:TIGR03749 family integrating conjugative element protein [Salmonella enterica]|nr:TIGR03749 family integrating conjugative element protein [Salmonella enterica]EKS4720078.1 TIGR03749 family integrating conjugative element protein [Salmonella enterica]EKS4724534.1 TIGR03749 family integrating conjugative element protein [Salmonella enterica]EKS4738128.1 TIGR03749 family integrating conjugative element protein [Salmonella enterica]EKS4775409.1 TIGR03749 family integrating conjugative element protein [Salmonella enterica]